ncbi:MAG: radical SAM protein [Saprospiraceae bacterium]|jgi:uncharacterized protein|nr:radical SAM protein [Saprospiraceae bacterium]
MDVPNPPKPTAIYNLDILEPVARDCDCACQEVCYPREAREMYQLNYALKYKCNDFIIEPIDDQFCAVITQNTNTFGVFDRSVIAFLKAFRSGATFWEASRSIVDKFGKEDACQLFDDFVYNFLLIPEPYRKPSIEKDLSSITVWLHISNQCNIACSYCYLDKDKRHMSADTGRQIIKRVFQTAQHNDCRMIKFKYAGGEPLLNFALIQELHQLAVSFSQMTGINIDEVVLTNGINLTKDKIEYIKNNGLNLMISLDGIEQFNDIHRHNINNKGTFPSIIKNIERTLAYGVLPQISITLSSLNAKGLPNVIAWVLERKLPFNLNFYRTSQFSRLQANHEDELFIFSILESFEVIKNFFPLDYSFLSIIDRSNLSFPHLYPCGVGYNYLVFDTEGNLSSCHMEINNYIAGTADEGDLLELLRKNNKIGNFSVELIEECNACRWKYWCASGCPVNKYNSEDKYDVKSPYCHVYKSVYPELIKLEGLRLLNLF